MKRLAFLLLFISGIVHAQVKVIRDEGRLNALSCTNWLNTSAVGQSVKIGDLDVSGNQITVESQFNRTAPYSPNYLYAGDIVSKHDTPGDANYLLRPNDAEITTTAGYFIASANCEIELNKTYHVALVYNGSSLKFYRNGFLMKQVAASGNLYQNNWITTIGDYAYPFPNVGTNFLGYINEVRIWNTARTQAEIQAYMNTPLPNPTTQTGLLANYTFDNLLNKQGNSTWDGILSGAASLNNTNPNCNFIADSCNTVVPVTLTTFTASVVNNKAVKLTWETAAEFNIKNYSVMRSSTGYEPDFISLGTVVSNGNALANKYNFIDNTARPNQLYYYKLIINDFDGSGKSGPTRTARIINKDFYTLIYPNPTNGIIKVILNNSNANAKIRITNNLGQVILAKESGITGLDAVLLDITSATKGTYWISIESGENKYTEKIIKL